MYSIGWPPSVGWWADVYPSAGSQPLHPPLPSAGADRTSSGGGGAGAVGRPRLTPQTAGGAWGGDGAGRQAGTSHFVPTTEQRYTSVVGVSVISPALAAAKTSVSEVSWVGATP